MREYAQTRLGVEVEALAFDYGSSVVLRDITIRALPGSFVGIVGSNGSGKTTLARLMAGKLLPRSGTVLVDGAAPDADGFDRTGISRPTWLIGSDPEMQFVTGTAFDEVALALQAQAGSAERILAVSNDALDSFGLKSIAEVHPFVLSTGQQFRLLLAVAVAQKPRCLLLDEVTSMLDGQTRQEIMRLLDEKRHNSGLVVFLFTHRLEDLARADTIVVLHEGRSAFEGSVADAFASIQTHPEWHIEVPLMYQLRALLPSHLKAKLPTGARI